MHIARSIIILFLILAIVFTYGPLARGEVSQAWKDARPGVILLMDGLYATIRNFVAGTDSHDGINDDAPSVDFDIIITEERGVLL
jgi:hypothetical protein